MNNGRGGEGTNGKRNNDFAYAVTKMAVTQICDNAELISYRESYPREGSRFSAFQGSALETLTDVAIQYIESVGKFAKLYANVSGRVEGNALDIVQALEDLGSGLGFDGAPDIDRCLADSGVVKDIIRYTGEAEEMPFVYSLPRFPYNKGKRPAPSFSVIGVEPPDEHIPVWLPAFPDTKVPNGIEETTTNVEKLESKEDQPSCSNMQQPAVDVVDRITVQKPNEEPKGNPFLAAPIWAEERNLQPPRMFTYGEVGNNHVHESHRQIPALEAATQSDKINDKLIGEKVDGEGGNGPRKGGALLRFKIVTRKASVCSRRNQRLEEKGWFQEGGDKRKKKIEEEHKDKRESIETDVQ